MSALEGVAKRAAEYSETANYLSKRLDTVRRSCFGLSIAGALLAAIAAGWGGDLGKEYHNYLAWSSALILAVAAFLTLRFLGKDSVTLYVKARAASEALKREAYLYASSAAPYDNQITLDATLIGEMQKVEQNSDGLGLYERKTTEPGAYPRKPFTNVSEYVAARLDDQIGYYNDKADELTTPSRRLHAAELVLAAAAAAITAVAALLGKGEFDMASLTAVITTLTGIVLSHLHAARYDERIIAYRATARRLENEKMKMTANTKLADLATAVERIIAAETKGWQAFWLN
jgi:hypothetical protein